MKLVDEGVPCVAQNESIVPIKVVWMQSYFNSLLRQSVHVSGTHGQYGDLYKLNSMAGFQTMFRDRRFLWLTKSDVAFKFFAPGCYSAPKTGQRV
jgi:hypothetical protein